MKKKLLICVFALFASFCLLFAEEYHYGFILSCNKTVYQSFDHQLSAEELLEWEDLYEETRCPDQIIRCPDE